MIQKADQGTHSPASSGASHQRCGQSVSHRSRVERKGYWVMGCAPSVIQSCYHLHLSRVIVCASKRDVRLAVLPSWLARQTANIHLRHKRLPVWEPGCRNARLYLEGEMHRGRSSVWVSVWGGKKNEETKNTKKQTIRKNNNWEFLWHWIHINQWFPISYKTSNNLIWGFSLWSAGAVNAFRSFEYKFRGQLHFHMKTVRFRNN